MLTEAVLIPTKPQGVYADGHGGWYFKVTLGANPLTGKRVQITKRGYRTAPDANRERHELVRKVDTGQLRPSSKLLIVNELLDLYLDGMDADARLAPKTRFDYRNHADVYIRPHLGSRKVRDITPEVVLAWQRKLMKDGAVKNGRPLAPNTVWLARAPLVGQGRVMRCALSSSMTDWCGCLRAQRRLQAEERLAASGYVDSDHVFTRPTGGPYHPANLSKLLGRMTTEVGLPRLTAHGLRHTSATLMLANGVPPKVAAERLGHADPTLFTNLYSHVTPTMRREAADKIGAALFD